MTHAHCIHVYTYQVHPRELEGSSILGDARSKDPFCSVTQCARECGGKRPSDKSSKPAASSPALALAVAGAFAECMTSSAFISYTRCWSYGYLPGVIRVIRVNYNPNNPNEGVSDVNVDDFIPQPRIIIINNDVAP